MDRNVAKNCRCISLQIQGSNPDVLQYNGMTNSETEIGNHTTLRMRLTGSNICRNYQSTKGNTMQKLTRTCSSDILISVYFFQNTLHH